MTKHRLLTLFWLLLLGSLAALLILGRTGYAAGPPPIESPSA